MKIRWRHINSIFLLLALCGVLWCIYTFMHGYERAVSLGHGYQFFGVEDEQGNDCAGKIDRGNMSDAERERWNKIWDKNIDLDPADAGAPRVGPDVDAYFVYPSMITGHVSASAEDIRYSDLHSRKMMTPGYFIIDTRTHRIIRGLNHEEWRMRLRKYGENHEPKLLKPS